MPEATRCLSLSEAEAKKQIKVAKSSLSKSQFQPGTEFEILVADAVVLQGLTHALRCAYHLLARLHNRIYMYLFAASPTWVTFNACECILFPRRNLIDESKRYALNRYASPQREL